jgi:hypothetical protein
LLEDILPMALAIFGIYEGTRLAQVALLFDDALGPGWYFFLSGVLFVWVIALLVRQIKVFYGLAVFFSGYLIASLIFFLIGPANLRGTIPEPIWRARAGQYGELLLRLLVPRRSPIPVRS